MKRAGWLLRRGLAVLSALALAALFYLVAVLGQPQEKPASVPEQPLLTASPAFVLTAEEELAQLVETFPAPVLTARGLRLAGGRSGDEAFDGGFGRVARLLYEDDEGSTAELISIYPARAAKLLPKGAYRIASPTVRSLAGLDAMRMEDGRHIRLQAQGPQGLYALIVPDMEESRLEALLRHLRLEGAAVTP